ncbi:MAG: nicotinate-nucleotide--dimethylbenzimidazole phosphoribosyltransferase [Methylomicrobium sp.]
MIQPVSNALHADLQNKIDQKTKPLGSLGRLEDAALRIGLIQNTLSPRLERPTVVVFAADHGIAASGVSAYPASVTAQMVANFLAGGAAISVFAQQNGLELFVVDAGVDAELLPHPKLIDSKIDRGTRNVLNSPAMSLDQCHRALQRGAEIVAQRHASGCNCIGFGEMGIGNTSSAALLMHGLMNLPLNRCVGRGTGLNDAQLAHKLTVLTQVIERHPPPSDPIDILATYGGFEIAMMTGAYLQAAELGMLIVVDGFIAGSALLVAATLQSSVLDYCVFSHVSDEHGHRALLDRFSAEPLLDLGLRLGEGSGIALAYPLLQSAVTMLNDMATFADANVDNGRVDRQ